MKRIVLAGLVVVSMAGGVALAADTPDSEKDWCLLGISSKCAGTTTIDLFDKIKRLNVAINKGTAVYTPEEIEHFKQALKEAYETEENLLRRR